MIHANTQFEFDDEMTSGSLLTRDIVALNRQGQFAGFKQPVELSRRLGVDLEADPDEPQRRHLVDASGRWRVVVGSSGGFRLTRSVMAGAGRHEDTWTHAEDQATLAGYLLVDVSLWPLVRVVVRDTPSVLGVPNVTRASFDAWFYGTGLL